MPIYEYQCASCGHQTEVFQTMKEGPLTDCPECHQKTLNKLISASGFQLKGTGWYVTDYRDKAKSPAPKSGEASTETSGTETKSGETKVDSTKAGGAAGNETAKT